MRKIMSFVLLTLVTGFVLTTAYPANAIMPPSLEETSISGLVETIEGTIDSVNAERMTVTVRWMYDSVMMRYQNVVLKISPSTSLIKNSNPIELRDIESGDHVTARYDPNAVPMAQALSLDIEE